jgi:FtsP/CotA-like multicopper oxidase with cupredoxin domain
MRFSKVSQTSWWVYGIFAGGIPTQARFLPPRQEIGQTVSTVAAADPTSSLPSASSNIEAPATTTSQSALSLSSSFTSTASYPTATNASQRVGEDDDDAWPVKYYDLTFTWGEVGSNGEPRQAILVNGQTPGPLIEVKEGQQVSVSRSAIHL